MTVALVPTPAPDDVALEFLDQLWRDVDGGWATLFSYDRGTGTSHTDWKPVDLRDELVALAMDRTETCCTWFGVATRRHLLNGGRRGGALDCHQVPAMWADIDIAGPGHKVTDGLPADMGQAMSLLRTCGLTPTCTVHTGGGIQAWWFLDQPRAPAEVDQLLRGWGAAWAQRAREMGLRVDNVFNVDRIMRLPGTINRKAEPTLVTIVEADWDRRYGLDDFEPYTIEPPAPPDGHPRSMSYIGPERPGDAFNARHTGAQVLERLGFQPHRPLSNGEQRWTGPWKDLRDGHSATIYPDGRTVIYSDSALAHWPALTVRTKRYLPFELYADTFHGGDYSAAARELRKQGYGDPNHVDDLISRNGAQKPVTAPVAPQEAPEGAAGPLPAALGAEALPKPPEPVLLIESIRDIVAWADATPHPGFLASPVWPADAYGVIGAENKAGKSWAILDKAVTVAAGLRWLGEYQVERPGPVLVFVGEGGRRKTVRRLRAVCEFYGVVLEDLPLRLCHRVPRFQAADHIAEVMRELDQHPAHLVIVDPLYLAAAGANAASVFEMAEVLQPVQHAAQDAEAALTVVHHWNKTGTGKDRNRFSGAGSAEWGRVLASVAVEHRATDPLTLASNVVLSWEFMGDEIPDVSLRLRRKVWAEDPNDLSSPLHYEIMRDNSIMADLEKSSRTEECLQGITNLLAVAQSELSQRQIAKLLRDHGHSYADETITSCLNSLLATSEIVRTLGSRNAYLYSLNQRQ